MHNTMIFLLVIYNTKLLNSFLTKASTARAAQKVCQTLMRG